MSGWRKKRRPERDPCGGYHVWPGYYGPGRLITDNWQSAIVKPDWAKSIPDLDGVALPVRRLDKSLKLGQIVGDPAAP